MGKPSASPVRKRKRSASWKERVDHLGHDVIDIADLLGRLQVLSRAQHLYPEEERFTYHEIAIGICNAWRCTRLVNANRHLNFGSSMPARAGIEGTLSQAVRRSEMRRSRSIGVARTHLQHLLTATALNLIRAVAWLTEAPRAKTRRSRVAVLLSAR